MKEVLFLVLASSFVTAWAFPDCWKPSEGAPGYLAPYTAHSRWSGRMVLAYMDSRTIQENPVPSFVWTPEKFEYLLGYKSETGQTLDLMFDSVLFIGYSWFQKQFWPGTSPEPMNQSDWLRFAQLQFDSGVSNVEKAAMSIEKDLKITRLSPKVLFTIPYPDKRATNWGTIDGKTVDFSNNNDRIKACTWYIDQVLTFWKLKSPTHVINIGFYWFLEEIYQTPEEINLLTSVADYIHLVGKDSGLGFHWIPYFGSPGYDFWNKLGFDTVTYQPNYAFRNTSIDRFEDVAVNATNLHMGIELELPMYVTNPTVSGWKENFDNYLSASVAFHFNTQSMLTFYLGNDFVDMAKSNWAYYKKLYWLVRGTYPNSP